MRRDPQVGSSLPAAAPAREVLLLGPAGHVGAGRSSGAGRAFLCESWLCKETRCEATGFAWGEVSHLDQPTDGVDKGLP